MASERTDENAATQWAALNDQEITVQTIHELLDAIHDDLWVAAACADRLVDDIDVQRVLLQAGIARTQSTFDRCRQQLEGEPEPEQEDLKHDDDAEKVHTEHDNKHQRVNLARHFSLYPIDAKFVRLHILLTWRLAYLDTYVEVCKKVLPESDAKEEDEDWEDDPWADSTTGEKRAHVDDASTTIAQPPLKFSTLVSRGLKFFAILLATQLEFDALETLLSRHSTELFPHRLQILEYIPEYAIPSAYRFILPSIDLQEGKEAPWSFSHVDTDTTTDMLGMTYTDATPLDESDSWSSLEEELSNLRGGRVDFLSVDEVSQWYTSRVEDIVSKFGLIDTALSLVEHASSQGVLTLGELGEDLSLLARLVYDSPGAEGTGTQAFVGLAEWKAMEPSSIISKYLAYSTPESIATDIRKLVMPYLFVLESRCERAGKPDPELPKRMLYEYILKAPLELSVSIFEGSKPTLLASQRLIPDDEDLTRLALACLYGSDSLTLWPIMSRIFECLPVWNLDNADQEDEADTTVSALTAFLKPSTSRPHCSPSDLLTFFLPLPATSLSHALDILDVHLESGEILSRWNVAVPLRWLLQSSEDEVQQRAMATKMARQGDRPVGKVETEEDWMWLMDDMLKLASNGVERVRSAFGLLSQAEVTRIFYSGLLSSGNFTTAQRILTQRPLDSATLEDLCLTCSREFYDNSSSGNYNFGDMKLAYDCLSLAPATPAIQHEREFIEATSRISSFNVMTRPAVPITPIEIRLTKDKLSLVSRVLAGNDTAYKHTEVILELMRKLGFQNDLVAEVKTLAMIAETALQAEDFNRAYDVCQRLVDTVAKLRQASPLGSDDPKVQTAVDVCWVACYQLGRQPEFEDAEKKLVLMGRSLELCPAENIADILTAWRKLEAEDLEERRGRQRTSQTKARPTASVVERLNGFTGMHASNLAARLRDRQLHSPSLPSAPDAAAMASQAFHRVAANFPFGGVRGRRGDSTSRERGSMAQRTGSPDVQSQARHVLQRGIGWLIGAEDDELQN